MNRTVRIAPALIVGILLASGCAQVGSPNGGSRDDAPPVVVAAEPDFGARDVRSTSLRLVFDEFVQLQDARRQILVSPPLPQSPQARVRGREVLVELEGPLKADRTYVIQFGNAVRDLREANVAAGLTHVFSTGAVLDSGRVAGRVLDAWTANPAEGARVLLYRDSLPVSALEVNAPDSVRPLPDYVGMVDDSGRFDIGYLPDGDFALLAVDDVNGNYRVDAGEAVAWSEALWASLPADSSAVRQTPLLRLDAPLVQAATYLSGMRLDSSGDWRARWVGWNDLAAGPDGWRSEEMTLSLVGPDTAVVPQQVEDSLWVEWPGPLDLETLEAETWRFVHPFGEDTLQFREVESGKAPSPVGRGPREVEAPEADIQRFAPAPEALDTALCQGTVIQGEDTLALDLSSLRLDGAVLQATSLTPGSRVSLELRPGALIRQGRAVSDTLRLTWKVLGENATGSLVLAFDEAVTDGVSQPRFVLTDGAGQPLYERLVDEAGRWTGLTPGRYGVVLLDDRDGNGRWTGVDPASRRAPEPVFLLATEVEVRAGWELELTGSGLPRP